LPQLLIDKANRVDAR